MGGAGEKLPLTRWERWNITPVSVPPISLPTPPLGAVVQCPTERVTYRTVGYFWNRIPDHSEDCSTTTWAQTGSGIPAIRPRFPYGVICRMNDFVVTGKTVPTR